MSEARARPADRGRAGRAPAPRPVPARRAGAGALRDRADGRRRALLDRERPARRGARDHRHGARAPARDDPAAAQPLVRARAGRAARPRLRAGAARARRPDDGRTARASTSSSTSTAPTRSARRREVALYTIIRELIEQSVRRGPPTRIDVSLDAHGRGRRRRDGRRRRRAGAPPAHVRDGRRSACSSCTASSRSRPSRAPARRSASRCRRTRRSASSAHRRSSHYHPVRWPQENGKSRGYLLMVWSPTGYSLRELEGDPPRRRARVRGGRPHARRDEDRPVAVPGRPAPLRVLARPLVAAALRPGGLAGRRMSIAPPGRQSADQ